MQILANALPGFRDLRPPLIAGYLWLMFSWLLIRPSIERRPASDLGSAAFDLAQALGPLWLAIATGTAAYLAGSASQVISEIFRARIFRSRKYGRPFTIRLEGSDLVKIDPHWPEDEVFRMPVLSRIVGPYSAAYDPTAEIVQTLHRGISQMHKSIGRDRDWSREGFISELEERANEARRAALLEPDLPATLLVGDQPELYAEVDRLRAEGDLRLAVTPPLVALAILVSIEESLWGLSALPVILVLLLQGLRRRMESRKLILDAIYMNRIVSPSIKRFSDWVDSLQHELQARRGQALRPER